MTTDYRTVKGPGQDEFTVQKSRFIAYADRAATETAALAFIAAVRKRHWDAAHNCAAYTVGLTEGLQKADDDGEPGGSAGRTMLEVLKKNNLKYTVVVAVRYFGGVKLGAGGLIRAYGKTASLGVAAARIVEMQLHARLAVEIEYPLLGPLENRLRQAGYRVAAKSYAAKVQLTVLARIHAAGQLRARLIEWTAARCLIQDLEPDYVETTPE